MKSTITFGTVAHEYTDQAFMTKYTCLQLKVRLYLRACPVGTAGPLIHFPLLLFDHGEVNRLPVAYVPIMK